MAIVIMMKMMMIIIIIIMIIIIVIVIVITVIVIIINNDIGYTNNTDKDNEHNNKQSLDIQTHRFMHLYFIFLFYKGTQN